MFDHLEQAVVPTPQSSGARARPRRSAESWAHPALSTLASFSFSLIVSCGEDHRAEREYPEHVILISIDTLRADHCSVYGYEKETTPFLESLGERGVVFENHMVNSNNTLTSHASILTGLGPLAHATYDNPDSRRALAPGYQTIAESFREAGFATGAFTTHPTWLGDTFGLNQGFDVMESSWCDAATNAGKFLRWYDRELPERMFVFLHFYDPHSEATSQGGVLPYDSNRDLIREFAGERPEGFTGCLESRPDQCLSRYLQAINAGEEELPADHVEYLKGLYDAGVRKLDNDLAELFSELERRGILDSALVVVTSDHGEAFMEHGQLLHGNWYDTIMHVPLIVTLPGNRRPPRQRIDDVTSSIDISPTLLDLVGLETIGQGQSLVPAILRGEPVAHQEVFFSPAVLRGVDDQGAFKLCDGPSERAFYDLTADPGETHNLFGTPGFLNDSQERLQRAWTRLQELQASGVRVARLLDEGDGYAPELDAEALNELMDLGYFGDADQRDTARGSYGVRVITQNGRDLELELKGGQGWRYWIAPEALADHALGTEHITVAIAKEERLTEDERREYFGQLDDAGAAHVELRLPPWPAASAGARTAGERWLLWANYVPPSRAGDPVVLPDMRAVVEVVLPPE